MWVWVWWRFGDAGTHVRGRKERDSWGVHTYFPLVAAALTRQGALGNLAIQSGKPLTTYLFLRLRSGRIWWAQMYRLVVPLSSRTWTCTECSCTHSVGRGHRFHVHNRVRYSCTRTAYARHAHRVVHYMRRIHAVCAEYCMRVHSVRIVKEHLIPGRRAVPRDRPRDVFPVWIAPTKGNGSLPSRGRSETGCAAPPVSS